MYPASAVFSIPGYTMYPAFPIFGIPRIHHVSCFSRFQHFPDTSCILPPPFSAFPGYTMYPASAVFSIPGYIMYPASTVFSIPGYIMYPASTIFSISRIHHAYAPSFYLILPCHFSRHFSSFRYADSSSAQAYVQSGCRTVCSIISRNARVSKGTSSHSITRSRLSPKTIPFSAITLSRLQRSAVYFASCIFPQISR